MTVTRRRILTVAGGVLGAGLLTGAIVMVARPPAEAPPVTAAAAVQSSCGLPGSPEGSTGATAARWESVGALALPVSETDGPGVRVPAGAWSCYARSPSGAVLSAITIALRADGAAENWQDVVRTQTMPGPGQQAKLGKPLPNADLVTLRGYDVAAYSPDRATVRYYLHTPTIDASCTAEVAWSDGDWRLVLGDDGSTSSGCTQGAPDNFTPWGP